MTLKDLLQTCDTEDLDVKLVDYKTFKEFMEFKAAGYETVSEDTLNREVKNMKIDISKNCDRTPLVVPLKTPIIILTLGDVVPGPVPPEPQYEYVEVTPVGDENPKALGWYENVDEEYVLTEDETVDVAKTYYERKEIEP